MAMASVTGRKLDCQAPSLLVRCFLEKRCARARRKSILGYEHTLAEVCATPGELWRRKPHQKR